MARFDIIKLGGYPFEFALDVQADLLSHYNTRVIIPLIPTAHMGEEFERKLKPKIMIDDTEYLLSPTDIASIPISEINKTVMNIEKEYRDCITESLDFLFQGF